MHFLSQKHWFRLHQFFAIEILSTVMLAVFWFGVLKMHLLIHVTPIKGQNGQFSHLLNPSWDVLLAVHEDPGPDFLHDLDSNGSYYWQESISRSDMLPINTLKNINFLGPDIDQDVGGPLNSSIVQVLMIFQKLGKLHSWSLKGLKKMLPF